VIYLKNGTIMDGTGKRSYKANILIEGERIKYISRSPIEVECKTIDCTGKIIAPGFIDAHSHQDSYIFYKNDLEMTEPFIRQGVTTHVGGNCGHGPAGMIKNSPYKEEVFRRIPEYMEENTAPWETYAEFFEYLNKKGIYNNLATLAAHGTALTSIVGLHPKGATSPENMKKLEAILDEGMDSGCKGISCGIAFTPGVHLPDEEFRMVAEFAKKHDKVISMHTRTYGTELPSHYGDDYSIPHNVRWHREFFEMFKGSGIKFQWSHLITSGRTAFDTFDQMMAIVDDMMDAGFDLWFDMYSYIQSATTMTTFMPKFFMDNIREIYSSKKLWPQLEKEFEIEIERKGKYPSDVIMCDKHLEGYQQYNEMRLDEIMKITGMTATELYVDIFRKSKGFARLYHLVPQKEENIPIEMTHPRALYMLDSWVLPGGMQNACTYGGMVKFLRLARDLKNQSIEETVAKMTGRTAARFDLKGRGFIKEGYYADITVFDLEELDEVATPDNPAQNPKGILHVFVNGHHVFNEGNLDTSVKAGRVI
jgi:N-acyl-D-amino-acid deacylase